MKKTLPKVISLFISAAFVVSSLGAQSAALSTHGTQSTQSTQIAKDEYTTAAALSDSVLLINGGQQREETVTKSYIFGTCEQQENALVFDKSTRLTLITGDGRAVSVPGSYDKLYLSDKLHYILKHDLDAFGGDAQDGILSEILGYSGCFFLSKGDKYAALLTDGSFLGGGALFDRIGICGAAENSKATDSLYCCMNGSRGFTADSGDMTYVYDTGNKLIASLDRKKYGSAIGWDSESGTVITRAAGKHGNAVIYLLTVSGKLLKKYNGRNTVDPEDIMADYVTANGTAFLNIFNFHAYSFSATDHVVTDMKGKKVPASVLDNDEVDLWDNEYNLYTARDENNRALLRSPTGRTLYILGDNTFCTGKTWVTIKNSSLVFIDDKTGKVIKTCSDKKYSSIHYSMSEEYGTFWAVVKTGKTDVYGFAEDDYYLFSADGTRLTEACQRVGSLVGNTVFPAKSGGKFGLISAETGKWTLSPRYGGLEYMSSDFVRVINNNRTGVIDLSGRLVIPIKYKSVYSAADSQTGRTRLFIVTDDDYKCGMYTPAGKAVAAPVFDRLDSISSDAGLFRYKLDSGYGIITAEGRYVTKGIYSSLSGSDNTIIYGLDGKYGLMSRSGKIITGAEYDVIGQYNSEIKAFSVKKNEKYGLLSEAGRLLVPAEYDSDAHITGSYAVFGKSGKAYAVNIKTGGVTLCGDMDYELPRLIKTNAGYGFITHTEKNGKTLYGFSLIA